MNTVNLSQYSIGSYNPGNIVKRVVWYIVNRLVFLTSLPIPSSLKVNILRIFGARVGKGVTVKPRVNIKYPWFVSIGNAVWIGEGAWLDSLGAITIGDSVCISQNVYLCTGNHDYSKPAFDLNVGSIIIEDGVWLGAGVMVAPNVTVASHTVAVMGSVLTKSTEAYGIYQGNPAVKVKTRVIRGDCKTPKDTSRTSAAVT